jgi:hypothetical protein
MFQKVFILFFLFAVVYSIPVDNKRTGRIVGGQKAVEGQFPYMVALRSALRKDEHGCGGFIINSRWIGSVAHCMLNPIANILTVAIVGTTKTSDFSTFYRFSIWFNHPEYVSNLRRHDIGLGRTRTEIIFTPLVQPIALGSEFVGAGIKAVISGWGTPDYPLPIGQFREDLYWIEFTTISNEECIERTIPQWQHMVSDENICTFDGPGVGACNGGELNHKKVH